MKNKNLLITGGATRVGKEIALHFANKGWNIALHYFKSSSKARRLKKIIEQNWVKAVLIKADLRNTKQVEKIVPIAKKSLGEIDETINDYCWCWNRKNNNDCWKNSLFYRKKKY